MAGKEFTGRIAYLVNGAQDCFLFLSVRDKNNGSHESSLTDKVFLARKGPAEGTRFKVEVIDTYQIEIKAIDTVFEACRNQYEYGDLYKRRVQLPGKPYMAYGSPAAVRCDFSGQIRLLSPLGHATIQRLFPSFISR